MAIVTYRTPWTRQPQSPTKVNRSHPIIPGIALWADPITGKDLLSQSGFVITQTKKQSNSILGSPVIVRGFGSTFGVGTTDSIRTSLSTSANRRTFAIWTYRNGDGGSGFGRIFDKLVSSTFVEALLNESVSNTYEYSVQWSGGQARWHISRPSTGSWVHIAVAYDYTSTASPKIYVDGIPVSVTVATAPSGSVTTNADAYVIGNRNTDNARTWDGMLGDLVVWDRILSAAEVWDVYRNMWQLFEPLPRRIWPPSVATAGGIVGPLIGGSHLLTNGPLVNGRLAA